MKKGQKLELKTTVQDVTDFPGGIEADIVIATGGGTKGNWTIGWSLLLGSIVMVYEDGQAVSARTHELFETMTKFRK